MDENPPCDACVRAKCCDEVLACDGSPSCKAVQTCLDACDENDTACALDCYVANETGAELLTAVGACASQQCAGDCN